MSLLWRAFDGRDIKVRDRTFGTWTGLRMRDPGPKIIQKLEFT